MAEKAKKRSVGSAQAGGKAARAGRQAAKAGKGPTFNIGEIHAEGDVVFHDQTKTVIHAEQISTQKQLYLALKQAQAQAAVIRQEPGLTPAQLQAATAAEAQIGEAVSEAALPQPLAERVRGTLLQAQQDMALLSGSLQSAAELGATLGGLALVALRLFGG